MVLSSFLYAPQKLAPRSLFGVFNMLNKIRTVWGLSSVFVIFGQQCIKMSLDRVATIRFVEILQVEN